MMRAGVHDPSRDPRDAGFTLAELLVAMGLFGVISTILLTLGLTTARTAEVVRSNADANGEARVAIERMAREVRQARVVRDVVFSGGDIVGFTVLVDTETTTSAGAPLTVTDEVTYVWKAAEESLRMQVARGSTSQGDEVLARAVTDLDVTLLSSYWPADVQKRDGTTGADGFTDWIELSKFTSPPINGNGDAVLDDSEAAFVDTLIIRMDVADGDRDVTYEIRADLRNAQVTR